MIAPIIVDAKSEILLFDTIETAEGYLEPIDVQNYEYDAAYDSEGRLLSITVSGKHTQIALTEEKPEHAIELERKLRDFLQRTDDIPSDSIACDLKCLIDISKKYMISTKPKKDR